MSRIDVTPLVPGALATAADVNATLTSWNDRTAAGQIDENNVRQEGIDRRTLDADEHIVGTADYGDNTTVAITTTGLIRSTGAYAIVTGLVTATVSYPTSGMCLLHASVSLNSVNNTIGNPRLLVDLVLQRSTNGGGAWTTLAGSRRRKKMRDGTALLSATTPGIKVSTSWTLRLGTTANAIYRVAFQTTDDAATAGGVDITFPNGVIFIEPFGA